MLSAAGASACGFRSPRFASGRGREGRPGAGSGEVGGLGPGTGRWAGVPPAAPLGHLGSGGALGGGRGRLTGRDAEPAARAAPGGEDASTATFGAVRPSPFCTEADGCGQGRLHSPGPAAGPRLLCRRPPRPF